MAYDVVVLAVVGGYVAAIRAAQLGFKQHKKVLKASEVSASTGAVSLPKHY